MHVDFVLKPGLRGRVHIEDESVRVEFDAQTVDGVQVPESVVAWISAPEYLAHLSAPPPALEPEPEPPPAQEPAEPEPPKRGIFGRRG